MSSVIFDNVDFIDSIYMFSNLTPLLNSISARKFAQLTLMQRNKNHNFSKIMLDKFINHKLVTDIVLHKYEENWYFLDNKSNKIENKISQIIEINNFTSYEKEKNLNLLKMIEDTLKSHVKDLFIFENFDGCNHKNRTDCILCKVFFKLKYQNISDPKIYVDILFKEISKINLNKAKRIFENIIIFKLNNLPRTIKKEEKNYNIYFTKVIEEFFGINIIPEFNYYSHFNKDISKDINKSVNEFFKNCELVGIEQFLCYKFMKNYFIPLKIKKGDININVKNYIIINYELFFEKIKNEFFRIYKTQLI